MQKLKTICLLAIAATLIPACKSPQKAAMAPLEAGIGTPAFALTEEEQRKYDYFFLEALKMKEKGNYDAEILDLRRVCKVVIHELFASLHQYTSTIGDVTVAFFISSAIMRLALASNVA